MAKRKYNKPFPLTMLQNLTSTYPTLWDVYDAVRTTRGVDYINQKLGKYVMSNKYGSERRYVPKRVKTEYVNGKFKEVT